MLTPRKPRALLLPEEERMIQMLGWTVEEYRWFCRESQKFNRSHRMEDPVAFDLTFFAVTLIVGIALNYAAALLTPRQQRQAEPARLEPRTEDGQDLVSSSRFTSRSSFTGLQNVVELNSPVPIVFAKREQINGVWYGGVRVNTDLLWSQIWSVSGSQLTRAICLVGEGCIRIDPFQTAMGDNLLGNYDLKPSDATNDYGRATLYFNCAEEGEPEVPVCENCPPEGTLFDWTLELNFNGSYAVFAKGYQYTVQYGQLPSVFVYLKSFFGPEDGWSMSFFDGCVASAASVFFSVSITDLGFRFTIDNLQTNVANTTLVGSEPLGGSVTPLPRGFTMDVLPNFGGTTQYVSAQVFCSGTNPPLSGCTNNSPPNGSLIPFSVTFPPLLLGEPTQWQHYWSFPHSGQEGIAIDGETINAIAVYGQCSVTVTSNIPNNLGGPLFWLTFDGCYMYFAYQVFGAPGALLPPTTPDGAAELTFASLSPTLVSATSPSTILVDGSIIRWTGTNDVLESAIFTV